MRYNSFLIIYRKALLFLGVLRQYQVYYDTKATLFGGMGENVASGGGALLFYATLLAYEGDLRCFKEIAICEFKKSLDV